MTTSAPGTASPPTRIALYDAEFAEDPHRAYARMRDRFGPLVPVELAPGVPATLVIGFHQARRILNDPLHFPADPRIWQQAIPDTCPVKPMMEWRPNALRSAGAEHTRYRAANTASLQAVDQHELRALVEKVASEAIGDFRALGHADLLTQYSWPIAFRVLSALLGCPDEIGRRIADGMAKIFDAEAATAALGNEILGRAVADLVALRRHQPGDDVTSRLIAHAARLDDVEMSHQLVTLYGAGIEPLTHLISNTVLKILTDEHFSAGLHAGQPVRDALDTVLYTDPPLANYCITYPPYPIDVDGVLLPAHQPVVISMAACNNDPAVTAGVAAADLTGNRAHLSWSIGPHSCPARSHAYLIAETAISWLLDALPELDLARPVSELVWRPGPFHRALESLPVRFPAVV
ncbi:cytochrome P450 [Streptomyces lucensis JCM 4490]|uniref:Cytochrome P450 n=1 Tax=Streptomyces lucensis JCM 4490 TaxID=1306176 RepID=A0A918IYW8_9ACTN|nr:cytochrome P450 [Streptomyces lucensis]GGW38661.1 cytochrome P450 [Streptomyces lucensis JCM 4490]